jgi:hypothetical protein
MLVIGQCRRTWYHHSPSSCCRQYANPPLVRCVAPHQHAAQEAAALALYAFCRHAAGDSGWGCGSYGLVHYPARMDRDEKAPHAIDLSGRGLELGPSDSPLVPKSSGGRIETLDHARADDLVANVLIDEWTRVRSANKSESTIEIYGGALVAGYSAHRRLDPVDEATQLSGETVVGAVT